MKYGNNIYKSYLIIFFHNLILAYVIERLFYEQRGLTVMMVVLCEVIYAATIVVLEIPSGILADKLSRKLLLTISAVLSMLEFVILLFADSFIVFCFVAFLAGISSSCSSGAFNALIYDSLLAEQKQGRFQKVLGRINALDFTAAVLAALSGSALAQYYPFELNYVLSAISMSIALLATLALKEPPKCGIHEEEESRAGFAVYLKGAIGFYRENPRAALVVVNAMAMGACLNYLDEFWQLYLRDIGFSVLFFGAFAATVLLIRIPGSLIAGYLTEYFSEEAILGFVMAVISIGFAVAALFSGWIGIIAAVMVFLASGLIDPVVSGYIHHRVSSDIRATVDSFQSLAKRAIMLIVGLGFGYIASMYSVATGFLLLGIICCLFLSVFAGSIKRSKPSDSF